MTNVQLLRLNKVISDLTRYRDLTKTRNKNRIILSRDQLTILIQNLEGILEHERNYHTGTEKRD